MKNLTKCPRCGSSLKKNAAGGIRCFKPGCGYKTGPQVVPQKPATPSGPSADQYQHVAAFHEARLSHLERALAQVQKNAQAAEIMLKLLLEILLERKILTEKEVIRKAKKLRGNPPTQDEGKGRSEKSSKESSERGSGAPHSAAVVNEEVAKVRARKREKGSQKNLFPEKET